MDCDESGHYRLHWSSLQVVATRACTHMLVQVLAGQGDTYMKLLGSNPNHVRGIVCTLTERWFE